MKYLVILFLGLIVSTLLSGQSRKELEEQRKKTLEEITYVDNLLSETAKEKTTGLNQLRIIGNKLVLRESVISDMRKEIQLLDERIKLNTLAVGLMENDLVILRKDYARTIVNSYKAGKGNPELGYILSAKDFNQGYKRLKYLQQVTKFRHQETETIQELLNEVEISRKKLQEDLEKISNLKSSEEGQKSLLQKEQDKKKRMVTTLGNKEKQLKQELEEKKRIARKTEAEIARVIEEEKKKAVKTELTPEMKLIGESFAENKGRLPWPVEKGVITSQFGPHNHPVLEYVKENNIGIEITCSGVTAARSVFKGQVTRVFSISGANMAVIIKHGKYFSVYQNLVNVKVKKDDTVETKQDIAEVFCDLENGSKSILNFFILEDIKYYDPELWIVKKR
jgi:septal ring factor EnvC (AmiA/AmiB activator)